MRIEEDLKILLESLIRLRQSGTTSLLREIAEKNNVHVMIPYHKDIKDVRIKGAIGAFLLDRRLERKPVLFDNHLLIHICEEVVDRIKHLKFDLRKSSELLELKDDEINKLKRQIQILSTPKANLPESPLKGKTVKIKSEIENFGGDDFVVEDYWVRLNDGISWRDSNSHPACINYAIRIGFQSFKIPNDNKVLYGKIGGMGYLFHETEIEECN